MQYDVTVVGGGPAGLSAAIVLARSLRSVLVVDAGEPRNAPSPAAHNVLGHEGIAPHDLLARGRSEAVGYGVEFRNDRVHEIDRASGDFAVTFADGESVRTRRIVLATGVVDELPDVPGLRDEWGHRVLHCPYCHGWEVRGTRVGVLGTSPGSVHQTLLFQQIAGETTLFRHDMDGLDTDTAERLAALGVRIVDARVDRIETSGPHWIYSSAPARPSRSTRSSSLRTSCRERSCSPDSAAPSLCTRRGWRTSRPASWARRTSRACGPSAM